MNWKIFPTGRWCTTLEAHGGHLALHAWVSGSWAVTRGASVPKDGDPFLAGSRQEGQPTGADLDAAMVLAEKAALAIADAEHPNRQ